MRGDVVRVVAGGKALYTLEATNLGPSMARDVTISDLLPEYVSVLSGPSGCTWSGRRIRCTLGDLDVDVVRALRFTLRISPAAEGRTLTALGRISTTTEETDLDNDTADATIFVDGEANLSVRKHGPRRVRPGRPFTYRLTVGNAGPSDARDARIVDRLPARLTLVGPLPSGCTRSGRLITCEIGRLAADGRRTFTFRAALTGAARSGASLRNTAKVVSLTKDPDRTDNTDGTDAEIVVPVPRPTPPPHASRPELPATGSDAPLPLLIHTALLLLGAGLITTRLTARPGRAGASLGR
ncbi:hypothetical protein GCM10027589_46730 [Actinocorallia lasiicapitis]